MKYERVRQRFLDQLSKVPIVQIACERCGISRQTAYRWRDENPDFAHQWDEVLDEGESFMNDMAESQLLQLMKEGHFGAIRYWLDRRHKKFKRPPDPVPTPEEIRRQRYSHMSDEELKEFIEEARRKRLELENQEKNLEEGD